MSKSSITWFKSNLLSILSVTVLLGSAVAVVLTYPMWYPPVAKYFSMADEEEEAEPAATGENNSLHITPQAWKNLQLVTGVVEPDTYTEYVSIPAVIVERPGRSQIEITAPMTGVVSEIYTLERQATKPGAPLFKIRLTHEDIVSAQSDFIIAAKQLFVLSEELTRLKNIGEDVIAGSRIVQQKYLVDQAAASYAGNRQSLLLHGFSEDQVVSIENNSKVIADFTVVAPEFAQSHDHAEHVEHQHVYHLQSINVNQGQAVVAGATLGVLADHALLYVEGQAFEEDAERLIHAAKQETLIEVVPVSNSNADNTKLSLRVQSVSDQVGMQSRALKFYLLLPNKMVDLKDSTKVDVNDYVAWKYRPGQRMEVHIATSNTFDKQFVLPPDAVATDGLNTYVFEQNGEHFDRVDVHVLFRDRTTVVVENDPNLMGSVIAMNGAHMMNIAIKNQAGGAIDPHAGHSH